MRYLITFNGDASGTRQPIEFKAARDGIALEWLHLMGCGYDAQLWRDARLLCSLRADLSHGFLSDRKRKDRPVGHGWHSRPDWLDADEPVQQKSQPTMVRALDTSSNDDVTARRCLTQRPMKIRDKPEDSTATGIFEVLARRN
jgi:hypothetical protein